MTTNPIPSMIAQALEHMEFGFQQSDEETDRILFRFPIQLNHMHTEIVILFNYNNNFISSQIKNPVLVPEGKRNAIFELIGMLNFNFSWGTFEMDHRDGNVRYLSNLPINNPEKLSIENISEWLNDSFRFMDYTFPGFMTVIFGGSLPSDILNKLLNRVDPKLN